MASTIMSPIKEVDRLSFHRLPVGTKVQLTGIVSLGKGIGGGYVALGAGGKLYTNLLGDGLAYIGSLPQADIINACAKLGVITKAAARAHEVHVRARAEVANRRASALKVIEGAQSLGIKLTKAQMGVAATALNGRAAK